MSKWLKVATSVISISVRLRSLKYFIFTVNILCVWYMNRKRYEILTPHSAPLIRWRFIYTFRIFLMILEIFFSSWITSPPPDLFSLLPNYGRELEIIFRAFFAMSFCVNLVCTIVFIMATFRSIWANNGFHIRYLFVWFSYQTIFISFLFVCHCCVYNSLETIFEVTFRW